MLTFCFVFILFPQIALHLPDFFFAKHLNLKVYGTYQSTFFDLTLEDSAFSLPIFQKCSAVMVFLAQTFLKIAFSSLLASANFVSTFFA